MDIKTSNRILVIAAALLFIAVSSCSSKQAVTAATRKKEDVVADSAELKEYQGKKLSSINALRENSIKGPQKVDIEKYRLKITGLVDTSRTYTYRQILDSFPVHKRVITMNCVEGWDVTILYEGPLVRDLIRSAGIEPEAKIVIFHSVDGYTTSLPLPYFMENEVILAHKMNGVVLPAERGFPFHLAAEDKWGYKWAKWVEKIELSADTSYRGFWESQGYSNSGDLNKPMFDRR